MFVVIYLWKGERHRDAHSFISLKDANVRLAEVKEAGFHGWIEEVVQPYNEKRQMWREKYGSNEENE